MIYVFFSQNIRLPSSTQFPIFKLIKHMKYTYSSKIIHTSSNSSLQLSFTTFWKNIFFHWSFIVPFYAKTIGESTACLLTAGDEHDYEKFYKIPLKSYWAGRVMTKNYDEKIIRPYSNLQVLSTNGSKIFLPYCVTDAIKFPMHGVD